MYSVDVVHTTDRGMEGGMSGGTLLPLISILLQKCLKCNYAITCIGIIQNIHAIAAYSGSLSFLYILHIHNNVRNST